MEVLDTTVANVSLPYIAGTVGVSDDEASWAQEASSSLDAHVAGNVGRRDVATVRVEHLHEEAGAGTRRAMSQVGGRASKFS